MRSGWLCWSLQRAVLMLGDLVERDTSEHLARTCKDTTASFADMIKSVGC